MEAFLYSGFTVSGRFDFARQNDGLFTDNLLLTACLSFVVRQNSSVTRRVFFLLLFILGLGGAKSMGQSEVSRYPWTVLIPENDSRDEEELEMDRFDSTSLVHQMNVLENGFHHHLVRNEVAINDLLNSYSPFCELRFDAVHPLILTQKEKDILLEYFRRGGFVLLQEDAYPYDQDELWKVTSWPVIDFITKELPESDFHIEKITDAHAIFHQVFTTQTAEAVVHELRDNPYTPNRTLVTYKGHPCAFVYGRYGYVEDGKWIAEPRPYQHVFNMEYRGYQLTVNIYVYASMH